jgi:hypothetical protein
MNKSLELEVAIAIIWKMTRSFQSMSYKISSSFKNEIKSSLFEEEPFEKFEQDIFQNLKWK